MELALACDLTIAADDCLFGAPEVRFGSGIVAMLLPWLAGPKRAKHMLLTGDDRVSAHTALERAHGVAAELATSIELGPAHTLERLGTIRLHGATTIAQARGPPAGGSP